jgi:hypothetical protein
MVIQRTTLTQCAIVGEGGIGKGSSVVLSGSCKRRCSFEGFESVAKRAENPDDEVKLRWVESRGGIDLQL